MLVSLPSLHPKACTSPSVCSYILRKQGTAKAKAIVIAVLKGEVKTAWGLVLEALDFAGDTAIFVAVTDDAQNPIFKAAMASIVVPVRADDPACPQSTGTHPCFASRRRDFCRT